jgi:hypothetical protein
VAFLGSLRKTAEWAQKMIAHGQYWDCFLTPASVTPTPPGTGVKTLCRPGVSASNDLMKQLRRSQAAGREGPKNTYTA